MRPTRKKYYMEITKLVAARSTCPRARVGAVLVEPDIQRIVATGYNGAVRGAPHCDEVGCMMEDNHCRRTIHAEMNAILHLEHSYNYLELYTTHQPCYQCTKALLAVRVKAVYYIHEYKDIIRDRIVGELRGVNNIWMFKYDDFQKRNNPLS